MPDSGCGHQPPANERRDCFGVEVNRGDLFDVAIAQIFPPPPVPFVSDRVQHDAVCACPALGDVADPVGVHRGEVTGKDDELGAGRERGMVFPLNST